MCKRRIDEPAPRRRFGAGTRVLGRRCEVWFVKQNPLTFGSQESTR